jgi:hypothetical protein
MQLQSLVVTVSSGSLMVSPLAAVSTSAFNNLGELVSNGSSGAFAVSANVAITLADASASGDPFSQTSSILAEVNFQPGACGVASASAFARTAYIPFSITGTSGAVTVQFTAVIGFGQSLLTGAVASTADADARASLILGNMFNVSQSSGNTIGTNSSWANSKCRRECADDSGTCNAFPVAGWGADSDATRRAAPFTAAGKSESRSS